MKRRYGIGLLCLMLVVSLMGCGSTKTAETAETAETTATEAVEDEMELEGGDSETSEALTVPEYDASQYVTLGEYKGMKIDKVVSTVSDEDIEAELENALYEYSEEAEITDGAKDENYVTVTLTLSVGDEVVYEQEDAYDMLLGFCEFGEDVDAALIGAKAGDVIEVDTELSDEYGDEYMGAAGHYVINVEKVFEYSTPEMSDEFVQKNTEYKTVDEFRAAKAEALQASNDAQNQYEAEELAISEVAAASTFNGYPQELYDYCDSALRSTYAWYAAMFGMEMEDLIDEEEFAEMVMQETNTNMTIQAIAQKENLTLTDEKLNQYLEEHMDEFGCESVDEIKENYEEYELRNYAIHSMVGSFILENAQINEMSREDYDAIYNPEEEMDEDDDDEEIEYEVMDGDEEEATEEE